MKKTIKSLLAMAVAAFAFTACSDVPEPYKIPGTGGGGGGEQEGTYLSETFSTTFGSFTVNNIKGTPWVIDFKTAKASGYDNSSKTTTESESYLVSKPIDLSKSENAYLQFEYILRYASQGTNKVYITSNYSGDPTTTTWTDITGSLTEGSDWSTFATYKYQLAKEFIGQSAVVVAFYYSCTSSNSATFEVKNMKMAEGTVEVDPDPVTPTDAYLAETFESEFGAFTVNNVKGTPWIIDFKTAKASGYDSSSKTTTESESYLVSKPVDLSKSENAYLQFEYILRYASQGTNKVYITSNYSGDPTTTTWTDITGSLTEGKDWSTFATYKYQLAKEFIGQSAVVVAFYYACTSSSATFEVKNLKLAEGIVETDPDPVTPTDAKAVTIAEFNAAAVSTDTWYQLTGTVKNLKDGDLYGNFDLVDETGTVYVYGLLAEKGGEKKKFQELVAAKGITEGSKITIIGNRGDYNGKIEVTNAYFVSIEGGSGGGSTPSADVKSVTVAEFNAAAVSTDVWYQLTGTIKNLKDGDQYGNFDLEDATGSVYVYGVLSEKGGEKKKFQELVAAKGIAEGKTITIIGNRGDYNGKIEVKNAYFVSIE